MMLCPELLAIIFYEKVIPYQCSMPNIVIRKKKGGKGGTNFLSNSNRDCFLLVLLQAKVLAYNKAYQQITSQDRSLIWAECKKRFKTILAFQNSKHFQRLSQIVSVVEMHIGKKLRCEISAWYKLNGDICYQLFSLPK